MPDFGVICSICLSPTVPSTCHCRIIARKVKKYLKKRISKTLTSILWSCLNWWYQSIYYEKLIEKYEKSYEDMNFHMNLKFRKFLRAHSSKRGFLHILEIWSFRNIFLKKYSENQKFKLLESKPFCPWFFIYKKVPLILWVCFHENLIFPCLRP